MLVCFLFGVLIQFQCLSISAVVCHFGFFQGGLTAVHSAAECGVKEVLKFLVEKGASVNAETDVSMNGKGRIELSIISAQSKL